MDYINKRYYERLLKLDLKTYQYYERLLNSANGICNLLRKLNNIEMTHNNKLPLYKKYLDYLQMVLDRENELYNNIPLHMLNPILDALDDFRDVDNYVGNNIYDEVMPIIRIVNRIKAKTFPNEDLLILKVYQQYPNDENVLTYLENHNIYETTMDNITIINAIRNHILEVYYNFLNDSFNKNNENCKNIDYKYAIFNTLPEIDQYLINNEFNNILISNYNWLTLTTEINQDLISKMINIYIYKITVFTILNMVNSNNTNSKIVLSYLLHSLLSVTNEDSLNKIKALIDSLNKFNSSNCDIQLLTDIINNIEEDKAYIKRKEK